MTDRHSGYIITLEADIREDDAELIMAAIKMVRGVRDVQPVVADVATHIAQTRERQVLAQELFKLASSLVTRP